MRQVAGIVLLWWIAAGTSFAQEQVKNTYPVNCGVLWPAVRDTVRNSGHYAVVFLDNTEMIATFAIGSGNSLRINSAVLDAIGDTCEMAVQPLYYGALFSNDAGDFKKRVASSLARLKSSKPAAPAKPDGGVK
ncbi:MAG: hypothetical protein WAL71_20190 [Terriglobales bacterium]